MNAKEAAERILELDKEATPGPWLYTHSHGTPKDSDGILWSNVDPNPHIGSFPKERTDTSANGDFIREVRNLSPDLARAYLEAVELLKLADKYLTAGRMKIDSISKFLEFLGIEELKK